METAQRSFWTTASILGLLLVAVSACQSTKQPRDTAAGCDGDQVSMDGRNYCVYKKSSITETGFSCPPEFSNRHTVGGVVVCSESEEELPEGHEKNIRTKYAGMGDTGGTPTIDTGIGGDVPNRTIDGGPGAGTPYFVTQEKFKQISMGSSGSACGVTMSNDAKCWHNGKFGKALRAPSGKFKQVSVSVGDDYACGIRLDGSVECWGDPPQGSSTPSGTFKQIDIGGEPCGVTTENRLKCWTLNRIGALGGGSRADAGRPDAGRLDAGRPDAGQKSFSPSGKYLQVSTAYRQACAVTASNDIKCWGSRVPQSVKGDFTQVTIGGGDGETHVCALGSKGDMTCWWEGKKATTNYAPPRAAPSGSFIDVSAENSHVAHACAVRADNTIVFWPDNYAHWWPEPPSGKFKQVSFGAAWICLLRMDNRAVCWRES